MIIFLFENIVSHFHSSFAMLVASNKTLILCIVSLRYFALQHAVGDHII